MLAGIGPILPSRRACIAPAMSATSPSAEISAPPAFSRNSESTARPRSGATNPRAVQSSIVSCWMCGGSAPIHPPADLKSKAQRGALGALGSVRHRAGELHAAVAPHQHRGRNRQPARGLVVGEREMPAIDAQRRRRQPRQRYPSRRGVDVDGAAQDLAGVGNIELGFGPHRHVEAFEAGELGQGARKSARHQALHGHRELQLVGGLDLVGAEVEGPGAGERLDLGPAGDRAAAAAMIEVDAELQHPPDALAAAVVDDDGCRLEPDLAQVGAGMLAPAGARGRLRQDLDEIDAAEPALGIDLACRWRNRRLCRPAPDRDLGALAARGLRGRCELERKRAVLAVEQRQARRDQVDAFGRDAAAQQRLAAERDRGPKAPSPGPRCRRR